MHLLLGVLLLLVWRFGVEGLQVELKISAVALQGRVEEGARRWPAACSTPIINAPRRMDTLATETNPVAGACRHKG